MRAEKSRPTENENDDSVAHTSGAIQCRYGPNLIELSFVGRACYPDGTVSCEFVGISKKARFEDNISATSLKMSYEESKQICIIQNNQQKL